MSTCPHANEVNVPRAGVAVHKDECCQCFDSPFSSPTGHAVCLTCFTGGCTGDLAHAARHHGITKHHVVLTIVKTPVQPETAMAAHGVTTTAAAVALLDTDAPTATTATSARCLTCAVELSLCKETNPKLFEAYTAVLAADSATAPKAAKTGAEGSDEAAAKPCAHTTDLTALQLEWEVNGPAGDGAEFPDRSDAAAACCSADGCSISSNLWLCLTCGALGCARREWDGSGGAGHGVAHNEATGHPLVLKLGTLTPAGTADVWCYACNDAVIDEDLSTHLGTFKIDVASAQKVGKTLAELELERNMNATFASAHDNTGSVEWPLLFGAGFAGAENIGNSCYAASATRCLLAAVPALVARYSGAAAAGAGACAAEPEHMATCRSQRPGQCFQCVMGKTVHALAASDRYSHAPTVEAAAAWIARQMARKDAAAEAHTGAGAGAGAAMTDEHEVKRAKLAGDADAGTATGSAADAGAGAGAGAAPGAGAVNLQPGIAMRALKTLLCSQHAEFSGTAQQCAHEYLGFLRDSIQRHESALRERGDANVISRETALSVVTRLECPQCKCVRYSTAAGADLPLPLPIGGATNAADAASAGAVPFTDCLAAWSAPTTVEGYNCAQCQASVTASVTTGLAPAGLPRTLIVQLRRFGMFDPASWVPTKLTNKVTFEGAPPLAVGDESEWQRGPGGVIVAPLPAAPIVDLAPLLIAPQLKDGEKPFPAAAASASASNANAGLLARMAAVSDEGTVSMLCEITGQSANRVRYALVQCAGDGDRAVDWIFARLDEEEPDYAALDAGEQQLEAEKKKKAEDAAAAAAVGAGAGAVSSKYRLRAFIAHEGASTLSGHYVAYVHHNKPHATPVLALASSAPGADATGAAVVDESSLAQGGLGWVCYNDNKVFQAPAADTGNGYVYFFERCDE